MESSEALNRLLEEYGIEKESWTARRMTGYLALLKKWNSRVNLTAGTNWSGIGPLFREAIWASGFWPPEAHYLLDIGSGAGFPAVIIQIMLPHIHLEMVESRSKKAAFLETVAGELGLAGTSVVNARLDEHLRKSAGVWDCITWKALKLDADSLLRLREHAHSRTQFWMFHGRELAVENPEIFADSLNLLKSHKCPGRKEWMMSVYVPR